MKAIVLPYSVDQNEPSTPLRRLFEIDAPDCRERMKALWREVFLDLKNDPEYNPEPVVYDTRHEERLTHYGDFEVEANNNVLFFTVIDDC